MRCPNCTHEVLDTTGYCPNCGKELPLGEVTGGAATFSMPALVVDPRPTERVVEKYSAAKGLKIANAVWCTILLFVALVCMAYFMFS